jgi:hypothetical protein
MLAPQAQEGHTRATTKDAFPTSCLLGKHYLCQRTQQLRMMLEEESAINLYMFNTQLVKYVKEENCRDLHTSISGLNLSSNTAIAAKEPEPVRKKDALLVYFTNSQLLQLTFTSRQQKQQNMPSVTFKYSVNINPRGPHQQGEKQCYSKALSHTYH